MMSSQRATTQELAGDRTQELAGGLSHAGVRQCDRPLGEARGRQPQNRATTLEPGARPKDWPAKTVILRRTPISSGENRYPPAKTEEPGENRRTRRRPLSSGENRHPLRMRDIANLAVVDAFGLTQRERVPLSGTKHSLSPPDRAATGVPPQTQGDHS